jgi:hypothetical protein
MLLTPSLIDSNTLSTGFQIYKENINILKDIQGMVTYIWGEWNNQKRFIFSNQFKIIYLNIKLLSIYSFYCVSSKNKNENN